jgi:CPA1 family monovalent cation:H+ antiporter
MDTTQLLVVILFAIALSHIADSAFPHLPLPLIQIGVGMLLSFTPIGGVVTLEPGLFMALLVAPILFREAEEADMPTMIKLAKPIIFMAFALVFITVFAVGFSVHALMPTVPLAACFALGAILGPTDAIAVTSLGSRVNIGPRIMALLKGEGLINDASGVISFNFAVAALITGSFSLLHASAELAIECVGGALIGIVLASLKIWAVQHLRRMQMKSSAAYMLLEMLMPFICYLAAEAIGVSGIIAAVAAGSRSAFSPHRNTIFDAQLAQFTKSLWEMMLACFNALVFLLLGMQLPAIVKTVIDSEAFSVPFGIAIGASATGILLCVRFLSVLIVTHKGTGLRNRVILTLSGVKGTVSLATAFSLPLFVADGAFAFRDMLLFVTATAIILSLLIAVIVIPLIARKGEVKDMTSKYVHILKHARDMLDADEADSRAKELVIGNIDMRISDITKIKCVGEKSDHTPHSMREIFRKAIEIAGAEDAQRSGIEYHRILMKCFMIERQSVYDHLKSGEIDRDEADEILGEINAIESHAIENKKHREKMHVLARARLDRIHKRKKKKK